MNWTGKKVVVTGAGGFIGSHLCERLAGLGAHVRAFVRYNSRNDNGSLKFILNKILKDIEVVPGEVRSPESIRQAFTNMEYVFHLASLIAIPYSYIDPRDYVETNVLGTINVLIAARELNMKMVTHTSTSEVYGTARYVPIDEKHPVQGQSPYSATKIAADKLAESFYCAYKLPVVTVRPFNNYGPRQSMRAIIPTIVIQALNSNSIKLGSIHPTRDFTFVEDTANGFLLAAATEGTVGEVINIGSGQEISMQDLVQTIGEVMGKSLHIEQEPERIRPPLSEVDRLLAGTEKAHSMLNWYPQTSLKDGLKRTITWIVEHSHLYNSEVYVL